jgi:class 3 adenylate cyclase/TolB-like protein
VTREQRRLAAIVSADVAGYSRLMGKDESGTLAALKGIRREVVDPKIAEHGGRIVKTSGDGLLLEFHSVVEAVRCAVEVQKAMAARNADVAEDRRIVFRVGINVGDVIVDGEDIFGDGVNVAARLQQAADPGGLYISNRAYEEVRDRLNISFEDRGEQSFKNLVRPVGVWRWSSAPPIAKIATPEPIAAPRSIAVLPFANLGNDPAQDRIADGITDSVTTDLSRLPTFRVIGPNAANISRDQSIETPQLHRDLGAHYALEGSVQTAGQTIRISVRLIDASSGSRVWADRFDVINENTLTMLEEIAARIVRGVMLQVAEDRSRRIESENPSSLSAEDLHALATAKLRRELSRRSWLEAAVLLEQAIELQPNSVLILNRFAYVKASVLLMGWSETPAEDDQAASRCLSRVYELRQQTDMDILAEAFLCLARKQPGEALAFVDRFSTPNNPGFLMTTGYTKLQLGLFGEGIVDIRQSIRLSPRDPDTGTWHEMLGRGLICIGEYQQAITCLRQSISRAPKWDWAYLSLACAHAHIGQTDEAGKAVDAALQLWPLWSIARIEAHLPEPLMPIVHGLRIAGLPE